MQHLSIGTITHGTMRPQDVLPALLDAIESVGAPESAGYAVQPFGPIPAYALDDDEADFWESDSAFDLTHELLDVLQEHAPPYCYVGAHPDDGSDIGVWPDWELIDMAKHDGELRKIDAGTDIDQISPRNFDALLVINDHGNATLYVRASNADYEPPQDKWREAWSIV